MNNLMNLKNILEWLRDIVIAIFIALLILFFLKPIIIQQESMQPNFYEGDYVLTSRQSYVLFGEPKRGDIIVFSSHLLDPAGNKKNLIKRIIAVPGDTIEIKDGFVYVNDKVIKEDYLAEQGISGEMDPITVPKHKLFVMGDNRGVSLDSRDPSVGFVDMETVIGKVVVRLYPFDHIKFF